MTSIPFYRHDLGQPELDALAKVLAGPILTTGATVAEFEERFAAVLKRRHAMAVTSCTGALHMSLLALGIGPGDEVITTPMTFVATAIAIDLVGAKPVFADIDLETALLDPAKIEAVITPRTKAIIPVHLYGQCADMKAIQAIADKHNLTVIEDAAQAHGAKLGKDFAGSMARISCFSFYPGKNLGAYGEGGLVATGDADLAQKLRMLRDWGQSKKYNHEIKGLNYRMDGVQGAVLDVKMRYIEDWTEGRRRVAKLYQQALGNIAGLELPYERPGSRHVWHVYAVRVDATRRAEIIAKLTEQGIGTNLHYPVPVHLQPCFAELGHQKGDFPAAEEQADRELSLPMFPEMTEAQVEEVARALKRILA